MKSLIIKLNAALAVVFLALAAFVVTKSNLDECNTALGRELETAITAKINTKIDASQPTDGAAVKQYQEGVKESGGWPCRLQPDQQREAIAGGTFGGVIAEGLGLMAPNAEPSPEPTPALSVPWNNYGKGTKERIEREVAVGDCHALAHELQKAKSHARELADYITAWRGYIGC